MEIDILIGAGFYWQFLDNFTIRIRSQDGLGPVEYGCLELNFEKFQVDFY